MAIAEFFFVDGLTSIILAAAIVDIAAQFQSFSNKQILQMLPWAILFVVCSQYVLKENVFTNYGKNHQEFTK